MAVRGVRGATTVEANTKEAILAATRELLQLMVEKNDIAMEDIAYAYFTTTRDLNAEFPAVAARQLGFNHPALLCGHELPVPGSLPMCLRILLLINSERRQDEIVNVYTKGASNLRGPVDTIPPASA